jgi:uncharacterized NAD(P)/FAD-binding protein YdhS
MTAKHVVVIGAGFSGVATAAALVRRKSGPRVTLIERGRFGPGLAYSTKDRAHLLNVRASNMSAYADKPEDFAHWLKSKTGAGPTAFATRQRYGEYAETVLKRAQTARIFGGFKRLQDEVVACRAGSGWWEVTTASGKRLEANAIVLALGNQSVSRPSVFTEAGVEPLEPWDAKGLQRVGRGDVLLIGAGLTMIDVALSLSGNSRVKAIYALSRRGLTPRMHVDPPMATPSTPLQLPHNLSDALHEFRREVRAMAERGEPWQLAVDRMRSVTPALWRALPLEAQQRFLRHLRVWWDVHRHRAAPEIAAKAQALHESGRLRVLAGEIVSVAKTGRMIEVYHRQRGSMVRHRLEVSAVVNCTGANPDLTRSTNILISQLIGEGIARPHPTGYGFDLDENARVIGTSGVAQPGVYAIGPITQGAFWESTAVPEIRARAAAIAEQF